MAFSSKAYYYIFLTYAFLLFVAIFSSQVLAHELVEENDEASGFFGELGTRATKFRGHPSTTITPFKVNNNIAMKRDSKLDEINGAWNNGFQGTHASNFRDEKNGRRIEKRKWRIYSDAYLPLRPRPQRSWPPPRKPPPTIMQERPTPPPTTFPTMKFPQTPWQTTLNGNRLKSYNWIDLKLDGINGAWTNGYFLDERNGEGIEKRKGRIYSVAYIPPTPEPSPPPPSPWPDPLNPPTTPSPWPTPPSPWPNPTTPWPPPLNGNRVIKSYNWIHLKSDGRSRIIWYNNNIDFPAGMHHAYSKFRGNQINPLATKFEGQIRPGPHIMIELEHADAYNNNP